MSHSPRHIEEAVPAVTIDDFDNHNPRAQDESIARNTQTQVWLNESREVNKIAYRIWIFYSVLLFSVLIGSLRFTFQEIFGQMPWVSFILNNCVHFAAHVWSMSKNREEMESIVRESSTALWYGIYSISLKDWKFEKIILLVFVILAIVSLALLWLPFAILGGFFMYIWHLLTVIRGIHSIAGLDEIIVEKEVPRIPRGRSAIPTPIRPSGDTNTLPAASISISQVGHPTAVAATTATNNLTAASQRRRVSTNTDTMSSPHVSSPGTENIPLRPLASEPMIASHNEQVRRQPQESS